MDADLKGANCKWSPDTLDDRCSKNVNVSSSKALGILVAAVAVGLVAVGLVAAVAVARM